MRLAPIVESARRELDHRVALGRLRARLAELEQAQHRSPFPADQSTTATTDAPADCVLTGFADLDEALGGGLRVGALNEVLVPTAGSGALEALLPALARAQRPPQLLAWIDHARLPYPPALARAGFDLSRVLLVSPCNEREQSWSLDLALRSGACDVVVAWLARIDDTALRRLQLAAETTGTLALFVRPLACASTPSPAAVRLEVTPLASTDPRRRRLRVAIRRCRGSGSFGAESIDLEWSRDPLDELEVPALSSRTPLALHGRGVEAPRRALRA